MSVLFRDSNTVEYKSWVEVDLENEFGIKIHHFTRVELNIEPSLLSSTNYKDVQIPTNYQEY